MSAVDLTRELVAIDTAGGGEGKAAALVAARLQQAGFEVVWKPWQPGRPNLVAHWRGGGDLTLAAHLDTVPFDAAAWSRDPLGGQIDGDRLYGRGSSDMKSGAAAMVQAASRAAAEGYGPFSMVFTSAEETGCHGARALGADSGLSATPVLVIGESTANEVKYGHKGATWLEVAAEGRSAHGSRPDLGINAIELLAAAMGRLSNDLPAAEHAALGARTTNVGTITGGLQTNLVPPAASMTVDVRTVPGGGSREVIDTLLAGSSIAVTELLDVPALWTDPASTAGRRMSDLVAAVTGRTSAPVGVTYFTDGAVMAGERPRAFILGPGDPDQPHTTDESVSCARIEEAVAVYGALLAGWSDDDQTR